MAVIQNICLIINSNKSGAKELAEQLTRRLKKFGRKVTAISKFPIEPDALQDMDLCYVIGGDGTILGIVEAACRSRVPVLGVNLGRLGFMAHFTPEECLQSCEHILNGQFKSRKRTLLTGEDANGHSSHALNDIVIRSAGSRLVALSISANGEPVNNYYADGLIFSTPTGSTAYNLSAGGPIIHPDAAVMVMTPINPHTLSNRAIVLDHNCILEASLQDPHEPVRVSIDGREAFRDQAAFPLRIRMDNTAPFELIQPNNLSHYELLRNKLLWAGEATLRQ
jgi:NAD+ kinase